MVPYERSKTQDAYAIVGGGCLGILLFYMGINASSIFSVEANFNYGATIVTFVIIGITFGYYLGRSIIGKGSGFTIFTASFLAVVVSIPILLFLLFLTGLLENSMLDLNGTVAMLLPFLVSFSLIQGDLLTDFRRAKTAFDYFCSKAAWYIFELNIIYTYEIPLLSTFISQLQSSMIDPPTIISLAILSSLLVGFFVVVHSVIKLKQE